MRVRELFHRSQADRDLDKEIQAHLDIAVRDRIERGEEPGEAKAAALREFGNRGLVKETSRDVLGWNTLEHIFQDLRYGIRGLRHNPGFTFIAITSLALGIGANTAIFSVMNAVMFRLLPVRNPGTLAELLQKYPGEPRGNGFWTRKDYEHFSAHNTVFSEIIGTSIDNMLRVQMESGVPQHVVGEYVTTNYFNDLGVQPVLGHAIGPENDSANQDVAVVSWSFWRNSLHADSRAVGTRIFVLNQPVTVIGVAPPEFVGLRVESATDLWLPLKPTANAMTLLVRLKSGITLREARAEMAVLYRFTIEERFARSGDPLVRKLRVEVEPAGGGLNTVRDRFGKPLLILMSTVGLLLLITCVNVAALLLARGTVREREFALRAGLGANRARLISQVLTESLLLSISGALFGMLFAYLGALTLVHLLMTGRIGQQVHLRVQPDFHLLLFSIGIAILTGLLFGAMPAVRAGRSMPASGLRQSGATGTRSKRFLGMVLVVSQIAFSVVLLSTGALFVIHLWKLQHAYLGFKRDHVLLVTLDSTNSGYSYQRLTSGYREILARLERMPQIRSVALASPTPLSGAGASGFVNVEGVQESPADRRWIAISYLSAGYFQTIGSPILAGRDFRTQDEIHPRVAIINQTFAHRYFSNRDPIGKKITLFHVTLDPEPKTYEVIGVTADANYADIREPERSGVFLPAFHDGSISANSLVLRTTVNPEAVTGDVRAGVREILSNVSILRTITLKAQIDASILPERLIATLSGWFAALGALFAAIGIYGLLAYTVAERTNEIGIRMALGATAGNVQNAVLREALTIMAAGLALGIPLAMAGRFLASRLVQDLGAEGTSPILFGAIVIASGALVASYVPVHRAAHVDPVEALRHE